jgi:hypothetical protein
MDLYWIFTAFILVGPNFYDQIRTNIICSFFKYFSVAFETKYVPYMCQSYYTTNLLPQFLSKITAFFPNILFWQFYIFSLIYYWNDIKADNNTIAKEKKVKESENQKKLQTLKNLKIELLIVVKK